MAPTKVIIDTDPGCDDAMALMFALASPELDVIGLTIVHGNHHDTAQLARNARIILERAGRPEIDVYLGANRAMAAPTPPGGALFVHGDNALVRRLCSGRGARSLLTF